MLASTVTFSGFEDDLRQVPIVGGALASGYVKAKAAAEAELTRKLKPYFIAAYVLGGAGVVLGGWALLRTRGRR